VSGHPEPVEGVGVWHWQFGIWHFARLLAMRVRRVFSGLKCKLSSVGTSPARMPAVQVGMWLAGLSVRGFGRGRNCCMRPNPRRDERREGKRMEDEVRHGRWSAGPARGRDRRVKPRLRPIPETEDQTSLMNFHTVRTCLL